VRAEERNVAAGCPQAKVANIGAVEVAVDDAAAVVGDEEAAVAAALAEVEVEACDVGGQRGKAGRWMTAVERIAGWGMRSKRAIVVAELGMAGRRK
jgi:hypothetical protein